MSGSSSSVLSTGFISYQTCKYHILVNELYERIYWVPIVLVASERVMSLATAR